MAIIKKKVAATGRKKSTKTAKSRNPTTKKSAKMTQGMENFWTERWAGAGLKYPENKKAKYKKTADLWR